MKRFYQFILALVLLMQFVWVAFASPDVLTLSRWTVDGGGGSSSGGTYTVNGSIGQPEAGIAMSGGNYEVTGGFWQGGSTSLGCTALTSVTIDGATNGEPNSYTFTANVTPDEASGGLTYTWSPAPDSGQGTQSATYNLAEDRQHTISVTVSNCDGNGTANDSHLININTSSGNFRLFLPVIIRSSEGTIITVNSTADVVANDGRCTLREAITAANKDSASGSMSGECAAGNGDDLILLFAGSYTLTIEGVSEDDNATGDLDLTSNMTIEVASGLSTIDGNQLDRVLHIHSEASVTIADLIITGGQTPDGSEPGDNGQDGGAIYNAGTLTLSNSTVRNNRTGQGRHDEKDLDNEDYGGHGGGIFNSGTLMLSNSHVRNNQTGEGRSASGDGGGIANLGTLILLESDVSNNSTANATELEIGRGGHGGGIVNRGTLSATTSTIIGNITGHGSTNTTTSPPFNGAGRDGGHGGGIANFGRLLLTGSTINDNRTGSGGTSLLDAGNGGHGGGIYHIGSGDFILTATIVNHNMTGHGAPAGLGDRRRADIDINQHSELTHHSTTTSFNNDPCFDSNESIDNSGCGGDGGGIYYAGSGDGNATLSESTVNFNSTGQGGWSSAPVNITGHGGRGAAVYNAGMLSVNNSLMAHNSTGSGGVSGGAGSPIYRAGRGGNGGALYNSHVLTLTNSTLSHNGTSGKGGALYNAGTFMLIDSTIRENSTGDGYTGPTYIHPSPSDGGNGAPGGGIYNAEGGFLMASNSTINANVTGDGGNSSADGGSGGDGGDGGAFYNAGISSLQTTSICDNTTGSGGEGGFSGQGSGGYGGHGGAIYNSDSARLLLIDSTICDNTAGHGGAGVGFEVPGGHGGHAGGIFNTGFITLTNSTISRNITGDGGNSRDNSQAGNGGNGGLGGGIYQSESGQMRLSSSTITANRTGQGGLSTQNGQPGADGDIGGVANFDGHITLENTILAGNSITGTTPDCSGTFISNGYNLVQDSTNCVIEGDSTGNLIGVEPLLDSLTDNGGRTLTHALLPGSPALDAGNCLLATDQRGQPRPVDLPAIPNANGGCDIGAFEGQPIELRLIKGIDNPTPFPGERIHYTITVRHFGVLMTITDAVLSDPLPAGVTFAGPVTLEPPQPAAILAHNGSDLPTLASNLTITAGTSITLTVPVTVNMDLALGTLITNTAVITSSEVPTPTTGSVTIALPAPDLTLQQTVTTSDPSNTLPGDAITYTLAFSNAGNALATNIVLTDIVPSEITSITITSRDTVITNTGATPPYVWNVADLAPGSGGVITITGIITPDLSDDITLINHATITATDDIVPANNDSETSVAVTVPTVQFSSATYEVREDGGSARITVILDGRHPKGDVTVNYSTSDGSATAGKDYTPVSDTINLSTLTSSFIIFIYDDDIDEPNETIELTLSKPSGVSLGHPSRATLTIIDLPTNKKHYLPILRKGP